MQELLPYASIASALPVAQAIEESKRQILKYEYTNGTVYLSPALKGIQISLALFVVAVTYSVLVYHAGFLVNTSKLPFKPLGENVPAILEATWPDKADDLKDLPVERTRACPPAIRLLYVGYMRLETAACRVAKGLEQCLARVETPAPTSRLWLTSGSVAIKAVVQLLL
jgi:hypothetical protein